MEFEEAYEKWLNDSIISEKNPRRRERLQVGLGHGSLEFLRSIWFPLIGNFDHLYPEWEVRDLNGGFRYLDFAFIPSGVKGGIEIQGYSSHARDLDIRRFKDLCWRQSLLALEGWTILPIAFMSIKDQPQQVQQLILAFVGRFLSFQESEQLTWMEAEVVRFSRRIFRPIKPSEIADHLKVSPRQARRVLKGLVESGELAITGGKSRARAYQLKANVISGAKKGS